MKLKKLSVAFLVLIMLFSLPGFAGTGLAGAKDILIRNSWAVMEQDGKPVGFGYQQFRQIDGGYQYITDITMQISMLGALSKITQHMVMTVDKQYLARKSSIVIDANGTKTLFKMEFTKTEIKMVITTSDGKETPSVFKPGKPVYFQESFLNSIIAAKKLAAGKEYSALIWDPATMAPQDCKLKINAKKTYQYGGKEVPVYEIHSTTGDNSVTSLISINGDTYWEEDPKQKLIFRRVEKNEIPELQAMSMDVRVGLIGQLETIIEDVKVPQDETVPEEGLKTGIQDGVYTNTEFRCRIKAPGGWNLVETKEQGVPLLVIQNDTDPLSTAILVLSSIPPGTIADLILQSRIQLTKTAVHDFNLIRQEQGKIGNYPVSFATWEFSYQEAKTRQENWILIQNDFLYLFVFTAPGDGWEDYQAVFQEIREAFQIL